MSVHDSAPSPEHGEAPGHSLFDATARTQQLEYELLEKVFGVDTLLDEAERTELSRAAILELSPEELNSYLTQEDELEGKIVQDTEFAHFLASQPGYNIFSARRYLTGLATSAVDENGLNGFRIVQIDPGRVQLIRHVPYQIKWLGETVQADAMQTITLAAEGEAVKTEKKTSYFSPFLDMPTPIEDKDNPPTDDIDLHVAVEKVGEANKFLEELKHKDTEELKADIEKHIAS